MVGIAHLPNSRTNKVNGGTPQIVKTGTNVLSGYHSDTNPATLANSCGCKGIEKCPAEHALF
jgi:hypothetical protein